jgi:hypothetical protein
MWPVKRPKYVLYLGQTPEAFHRLNAVGFQVVVQGRNDFDGILLHNNNNNNNNNNNDRCARTDKWTTQFWEREA